MQQRLRTIWAELRSHAPFTLFGALTGVVCMVLFKNLGPEINHRLFQVFHPAHVVLSAIVTASMFKLYEKNTSLLKVVVIGYLGAIGVATMSDSILPFFGESIFGVALPLHSHAHASEGDHSHAAEDEHAHVDANAHTDDEHDHASEDDHAHADANTHTADKHDHSEEHPAALHDHTSETESTAERASIRKRLHFGFIEDWYLVNPAALLGIAIAFFLPRTRFPHAGHVLISTWASSFHVLMNTRAELTTLILIGMFAVLFIAVWLPCCVSDIIFPLLFAKPGVEIHRHHR